MCLLPRIIYLCKFIQKFAYTSRRLAYILRLIHEPKTKVLCPRQKEQHRQKLSGGNVLVVLEAQQESFGLKV